MIDLEIRQREKPVHGILDLDTRFQFLIKNIALNNI